jgi:hypothetical protein
VALHFHKGLAGAPPDAVADARDTAINPAVLTAFALAIIAAASAPAYPRIPGHEPDLTFARRDAAAIDMAMGELRNLVPVGGSYVLVTTSSRATGGARSADRIICDCRRSKATYDPDGLFFVHHGVGSEEWSDDGFTRLSAR